VKIQPRPWRGFLLHVCKKYPALPAACLILYNPDKSGKHRKLIMSASTPSPLLFLTGAAGNLGRAVMERFAAGGYKITGTVRAAEGAASLQMPAAVSLKVVDLLSETATRLCVVETIQEHGHIDVAILTAGGFASGALAETSLADIRNQCQLNFETAYTAARAVFQHMLENKRGSIFLVGSLAGLYAGQGKGLTAYSLSKSLLFRLAELMNEEAAGTAVFTTVVVPSVIDTPQNRTAMPGADLSSWQTPESIADVLYG